MHHSYKALKEFEDMDAKQRMLILMASGMRQWRDKKAWQNYFFNFLFIAIPPLALLYVQDLFESGEMFLLATFVMIFLGYKIAFHFHVMRMLPYIRQCIDHGITEEELAKINAVKRPIK